ncbi:TPA: hypothetical protein ACWWUI_004424, partial [Citrobacter youngae]
NDISMREYLPQNDMQLIYYDTYLKREIALCHWDDTPSFFYKDYIRVDKLISGMGGQILYHEAVH